jgi:hypothetical protein
MGKFQKGGNVSNKGQFKPGQSGNPGGRPKAIVDVAAAARDFTLEGIEILKAIARREDATDTARTSAVKELLDRAWGKAPQTLDLRKQLNLDEMTDAELAAIAASGRDDEQSGNGSEDTAATPGDPKLVN